MALMEALARAWIPSHLAGGCRQSSPVSVEGNQVFFSRASGKYIIKMHILKKTKTKQKIPNPDQFVQRVVYLNSIFDTFSFVRGGGEGGERKA